jgi:hypothetical protein
MLVLVYEDKLLYPSHGILSRKENTLYFIKKSEDNEIKKFQFQLKKFLQFFVMVELL